MNMKYEIRRVQGKAAEQACRRSVLYRHGVPATDPVPSNAELEFWYEIERLRGLLREAQQLCIEHCPSEMSSELVDDWYESPASERGGPTGHIIQPQRSGKSRAMAIAIIGARRAGMACKAVGTIQIAQDHHEVIMLDVPLIEFDQAK